MILNSTRASDIPTVIKGLDQEQQSRLMAYLYKGMSALGQGADVSGSVLLTWHEKVSYALDIETIPRPLTRSLPRSLELAASFV